jgi:hypothetical protein
MAIAMAILRDSYDFEDLRQSIVEGRAGYRAE